MGTKRRIGSLAIFGLIILAGWFVVGVLAKPGAERVSEPRQPTLEKPEVIIQAQLIRAKKVNIEGDSLFEVVIDYKFHNPGRACTVRFDIPEKFRNQNESIHNFRIWEDGTQIDINSLESWNKETFGLNGGNASWGSEFKSGADKIITSKYYLVPRIRTIHGEVDYGFDDNTTVTGLHHIYYSTVEEISLPVEFSSDWFTGDWDVDIQIDFGEPIFAPMLIAAPSGYDFNGRRIHWAGKASDSKFYKAGVMNIAEAFSEIGHAKEFSRSISDRSYVGYIENLNSAEKKRLLRIARNGVFAKYGYNFKGEMASYFGSLAWYKKNPDFTEELLTQEDRDIVKLLLSTENRI